MISNYINLVKYTDIKIFFFNSINLYSKFIKFIKKYKSISKSQIYQDLFVLYKLKLKKNGFFIEIGGGDGKNLSNSYILEKFFFWKGLICEPDKRLHKKIIKNRNCSLIKNPISNKCKKVFFYQSDLYNSSIKKNVSAKKIIVKSMCLNHLIKKNNKKNNQIDYISIDTEGNEYEILKNFNFKKHHVTIFTIEHNFKSDRYRIEKLMKKNNYTRKYRFLSYMDDWYIKNNF